MATGLKLRILGTKKNYLTLFGGEIVVTREMVIDRLNQLGYTPVEDDFPAIDFELNSVISYTLNYCNIKIVPDMVEPKLIDRVCSQFLYYKKNSGSLNGFNYDNVIKSIKEGDTTITYSVGQGEDTPENRFDSFVKKLEQTYDKWLTKFRCIKW